MPDLTDNRRGIFWLALPFGCKRLLKKAKHASADPAAIERIRKGMTMP
jgi:hypothetical protein